jgi:thiamine-monophosphate kinase
MKLTELGEFAFIDRITPGCDAGERGHVVMGIGDDAAVVRQGDDLLLVTTDLLVERVHFLRGTISFSQLGYKALAVNLSDIAAMGGTPQDAFISIAVPADVAVEELDQLYDGMKELARRSRVNLLGGDTGSRWTCASTSSSGRAGEQVLYRTGARVGDRSGHRHPRRLSGGLAVLLENPELPDSVAQALLDALPAGALPRRAGSSRPPALPTPPSTCPTVWPPTCATSAVAAASVRLSMSHRCPSRAPCSSCAR